MGLDVYLLFPLNHACSLPCTVTIQKPHSFLYKVTGLLEKETRRDRKKEEEEEKGRKKKDKTPRRRTRHCEEPPLLMQMLSFESKKAKSAPSWERGCMMVSWEAR